LLIEAHEAAVPGHVSGKDGGWTALNLLLAHGPETPGVQVNGILACRLPSRQAFAETTIPLTRATGSW